MRKIFHNIREAQSAFISIGIPLLIACIFMPHLILWAIGGTLSAIPLTYVINWFLRYRAPERKIIIHRQ